MKRALPLLWLGLLLMAGCNDGPLRPTIPPITGLVHVGGPNAPNGTGQVAIEVATDSSSVVPGTTIHLQNQSRATEPVDQLVEGLDPFTILLIGGDVGDVVLVSLTHPEQGGIEGEFTIAPPSISDVFNSEAGSGNVIAGAQAAVVGSGYCVDLCDTVFFAGTPIEVVEPRPAQLFFTVPNVLPGDYTVTVSVAGNDGADERYNSQPFNVTVVP